MIQLEDVAVNLAAPVIAASATLFGAYLTTRSVRKEQKNRRNTFDALSNVLQVSDLDPRETQPLRDGHSASGWRPAGHEEDETSVGPDESDGKGPVDAAPRELALYLKYQQGSLRQSSSSFWISFGVGIFGFAVILTGVLLAIFGGAEQGVVAAVSGVVPTTAASLLYARADVSARRADEKFEKLAAAVRQMGAMRRASDLAALIDDARSRDRALSILCLQQVFPNAGVEEVGRALRPEADSRA